MQFWLKHKADVKTLNNKHYLQFSFESGLFKTVVFQVHRFQLSCDNLRVLKHIV